MSARPWDASRDTALLASWCGARGLAFDPELYPPTGIVSGECIAAFVYRTDASVAYVDNMVSDPYAGRRRVHAAMAALVPAIVDAAFGTGASVVVAPFVGGGARRMLLRMGFVSQTTDGHYFAIRRT